MKKICLCGHLGYGHNLLNGQTIKTKIIVEELEREYGKEELYVIDTHGKRNTILMFVKLIWALMTCRNIVILPAHSGVRIIPLWLVIWNVFFHRTLHYIVIGGWLACLLDIHKITKWSLAPFIIYAETSTMQKALQERNLRNVIVLPNCKQLEIVKEDALQTKCPQKPLRLVTFSRVMKQKGIGDAAHVVDKINQLLGEEVFTLDIYGQVEENEIQWFADEQKKFSSSVSYKGLVDFDKSVETLSSYFALLFPTHFYTEGIPGTIIDAYAAGVPVISARWESYNDIVEEGKTGMGYEFDNIDELKNLLINIANSPSLITSLKHNCIRKAETYLPKNVIPQIKFV